MDVTPTHPPVPASTNSIADTLGRVRTDESHSGTAINLLTQGEGITASAMPDSVNEVLIGGPSSQTVSTGFILDPSPFNIHQSIATKNQHLNAQEPFDFSGDASQSRLLQSDVDFSAFSFMPLDNDSTAGRKLSYSQLGVRPGCDFDVDMRDAWDSCFQSLSSELELDYQGIAKFLKNNYSSPEFNR